ncbi:MAG: hypothetical protein M3N82_03870 [Pseudomonadota bacterium]|nr:hypothetical protein [Pseudomonadota bacterium]
MSETEFLQELGRCWPRDVSSVEPTSATLTLANEAVNAFPNSALPWTMRGDLLQLAQSDAGYELGEVKRSYRMAIKADPRYAPAYDELGRFLVSVMDNRRKAKRFLDKARRLRRSAAMAGTSSG